MSDPSFGDGGGPDRPEFLTGRLLVASPLLTDPNFHRTVVFMVRHSTMGALGLVLNRPSDALSGETLPGWSHVIPAEDHIFTGGPVEESGLIAIARRGSVVREDWPEVIPGVSLVDLGGAPSDVEAAAGTVRIFSGHSGWGPDQLDLEIAEGAWWNFAADPDDVVTSSPETLWHDVVARQRGRVSWLADYPDDPMLN